MKYFKYIFKYMFVLLIFAACSDDSSTNSTGDSIKLGEMTATLNGQSFKSAQAQGMKLVGNSSYQITGMTATGNGITLITQNIAPGTYSNGYGSVNIIPNFNPALQEAYSKTNVTYTIKSFENGEIEGSFEFTANQEGGGTKTAIVKNAKFKVKVVN